jgi:hypothetical protein
LERHLLYIKELLADIFYLNEDSVQIAGNEKHGKQSESVSQILSNSCPVSNEHCLMKIIKTTVNSWITVSCHNREEEYSRRCRVAK